jgi:predicted CoA-substrate-specific enzyme activase
VSLVNDLSTICAGIDAGSRAIKIVLIESPSLRVIDSICADQGVHQDALATRLLDDLLARNSLSRADIARTVATGYARNIISLAHTTITEITCHACGVSHVAPGARTVVEIGGQDSKLLCLQEDGSVRDFAMNDRCAAGTGRFLEIVAQRLEVPLNGLGPLAATSTAPAAISSMCVVFAETEIIGLLASGISEADIVAGVQLSIAQRVAALAGGKVQAPVVFTGGVALLSGMDQALAKALDRPVTIAPTPQMTGALGAAILAARQTQK